MAPEDEDDEELDAIELGVRVQRESQRFLPRGSRGD